jgi:D-glycero-alpha-D-manno-heptose-7-phosphate kinase
MDGRIHFVARDLGISESFSAREPHFSGASLQLHAGVMRRIVTQFLDGIYPPIKISTMVDAPMGSGLGSSSALVVALVEAFRTLANLPLGPYEIARIAYEVERIELNLAGGRQDHYAAAFGGMNFIEFLQDDRVIVNPLRVQRAYFNELQTSLITCFSGVSRRSEAIIDEQQRSIKQFNTTSIDSLHQLKQDAIEMKRALLSGEIGYMADLLNQSWQAKKRTASGVSTQRIEELLNYAFSQGAIGAKVSGAGGGGFLMLIVDPELRFDVLRALNSIGAVATGADFTTKGVESWTSRKRFMSESTYSSRLTA